MARFAILILLISGVSICAQEPAPKPTIDQLLAKVTELRRQKADLEKQEQAATAELLARFRELQAAIEKLGLVDPKPVPPNPKPPEPTDPLKVKLKAAFDADSEQLDKRREHAKDLAALYRQAAKLASDNAVSTAGELLDRVRAAAGMLVGADALKECRRVVAGELGKVFPTDGDLTAEQRTAAAELFTKLAAILEGL